MNWITLHSAEEIEEIARHSHQVPCVIFKHSTRCSISQLAKTRLEGKWLLTADQVPAYYLDLLQYRSVSNKVTEFFAEHHESPQLLLIHKGTCVYVASHLDITYDELTEQLALLSV
jgi:bacillithiol system protein YtxJ